LNDLVKDQWDHNMATFYFPAPKSHHTNNGIYSASPGHVVFEICIDEIQRNLVHEDRFIVDAVKPGMIASCIDRYAQACSAPIPNFRQGHGPAIDMKTDYFITYGDIRMGLGSIGGNTESSRIWQIGAGSWLHSSPKKAPILPTDEKSLCMKRGEDASGCTPFDKTCPQSWLYYQQARGTTVSKNDAQSTKPRAASQPGTPFARTPSVVRPPASNLPDECPIGYLFDSLRHTCHKNDNTQTWICAPGFKQVSARPLRCK
jgi:hypothetical protein